MQINSTQSGSAARRGFTMLELLIVLAIIAILVSISFVVYGGALENAREEATRATLRQLDSALQERLDGFGRLNLKPQAQRFKLLYDNATPPNTPPTIPLELAEIIVRKDRFRATLPSRLEDIWGFNCVPDATTPNDDAPLWEVWKKKTGRTDRDPAAPDPNPLESSELLYLTLTEGGAFGAPILSLDRLRASHVRDTDGNGLMELYDEWGTPLRFYTWTSGLIRPLGELGAGPPSVFDDIEVDELRRGAYVLIPSLPKTDVDIPYDFDAFVNHPLCIDPLDPTGALIAAQNVYWPGGMCHYAYTLGNQPNQMQVNGNWYNTTETYSVPLIVSAGPDGKLGLDEPSTAGHHWPRLAMPLDFDQIADDLTNRQP